MMKRGNVMGLLRKYPLLFRKTADEHTGAKMLRQIAVLMLLVTAFCWSIGCIEPVFLAPAYLAAACCMYLRLRHVRLMAAAVMLVHQAYTLLHCVMDTPVWLTEDPLGWITGAMQKLCCVFYLAVVMYLYISPSIAEYYEERRNET